MLIRLRRDDVEVVVETATGAPTIVHWGAPLGDDADLDALTASLAPPLVPGALDVVAPLSVVPEHGAGFPGRPGLDGRRGGGRAWSPRFETLTHTTVPSLSGETLVVDALDEVAGLALTTNITLADALRVSVTVENTGDRRYSLDRLTPSLPVPEHAAELLTFTGRWGREFEPVRRDWTTGSFATEARGGRTSHGHPPLLFAGDVGFTEWNGEVWGVHVGWSGNHQLLAEALPDGRRHVQGGELLHPGEIVLEPGETYTSPDLIGVYSGSGLTAASWGFHRSVRAQRSHPTAPRPVTLNTWEAVYFDHDLDTLRALATKAAELGVERFVLDDGWFGSRRDDTSGLGDWFVSPDVYPDGLTPLIDHVTGHGMQFGIWVEPEMVNPDSDLYRAHPEWALATEGYEPVRGRKQLVLDLGRPDAFDHVLGRLDVLLADHDISFVKWDMNRDLVQASGADGAAGAHAQMVAVYRMIDELRLRHPDVEFESCASGGGRVDHEILRRVERVWTSDCNDALDRQRIQRGASMFVPPEVMGAHIGPTRSHTTSRMHSLAFRGATALFGHLGIEWDIRELSDADRERLQTLIAVYKEFRELLHTGDAVRFETDPAFCAHGVYAADRSQALVSFARLDSSTSLSSPPLRLPGLDSEAAYRLSHLRLPGEVRGPAMVQPAWMDRPDGLIVTGAQLAAHGVRPPTLHPESAVLFTMSRL